jgi:hypothetical protein
VMANSGLIAGSYNSQYSLDDAGQDTDHRSPCRGKGFLHKRADSVRSG